MPVTPEDPIAYRDSYYLPGQPGGSVIHADPDPVPALSPSGGGGSKLPPGPPLLPAGGDEPSGDGEDAGGGPDNPGSPGPEPWPPGAGSPVGDPNSFRGSDVGDGLGRVGAGGLDSIRESVEDRADRVSRQRVTQFEACAFQGYVTRATIKPGGDLEITIGVPPEYKWEAFRLSDASGLMVQFDAYLPGELDE